MILQWFSYSDIDLNTRSDISVVLSIYFWSIIRMMIYSISKKIIFSLLETISLFSTNIIFSDEVYFSDIKGFIVFQKRLLPVILYVFKQGLKTLELYGNN